MRTVREALFLLALALVPVVAAISIQSVSTVEPLVAGILSGVSVVLPLLAALFVSASHSDGASPLAMLSRPLRAVVTSASRDWLTTAIAVAAAIVITVGIWKAGAGSLSRFAFSCLGTTSVRWSVLGQKRFRSCTEAEILTVWVPPLTNRSALGFACSGGGITLQPYPPSHRREEWLCPNNRCPADMVYLPGGFGSEVGSVQPFCIDRTDVTVGDFATCPGCSSGEEGLSSDWPGANNEAKRSRTPFCTRATFLSHHPINCVDFNAAVEFCNSRSRRLPSTTQWYWAASGADADGAPFPYPWGRASPDNDRICYRPAAGSCPVGSFPKGTSVHGISDLMGNVWQWTSTTGRPGAVVVGGGWGTSDFPQISKVTLPVGSPLNGAFWAEKSVRSNIVGFRCASDPLSPSPKPIG